MKQILGSGIEVDGGWQRCRAAESAVAGRRVAGRSPDLGVGQPGGAQFRDAVRIQQFDNHSQIIPHLTSTRHEKVAAGSDGVTEILDDEGGRIQSQPDGPFLGGIVV